ncbi:unnamed protein product [Vitrella brassicaformis CCMP3155]|uniref:Uncharacterized protein n=1 Tax=Vitrella brassicaformis (strain CCMP3155) TaxID=1169540 RepID=A0A0G4EJ67_VITBC|nr:unnamed protein product [Vitrella brassicaformis CCMP3155]|eukprot:CEL96326.1 unnamed protein product [Vitrella brassicaformis CCMP3155]
MGCCQASQATQDPPSRAKTAKVAKGIANKIKTKGFPDREEPPAVNQDQDQDQNNDTRPNPVESVTSPSRVGVLRLPFFGRGGPPSSASVRSGFMSSGRDEGLNTTLQSKGSSLKRSQTRRRKRRFDESLGSAGRRLRSSLGRGKTIGSQEKIGNISAVRVHEWLKKLEASRDQLEFWASWQRLVFEPAVQKDTGSLRGIVTSYCNGRTVEVTLSGEETLMVGLAVAFVTQTKLPTRAIEKLVDTQKEIKAKRLSLWCRLKNIGLDIAAIDAGYTLEAPVPWNVAGVIIPHGEWVDAIMAKGGTAANYGHSLFPTEPESRLAFSLPDSPSSPLAPPSDPALPPVSPAQEGGDSSVRLSEVRVRLAAAMGSSPASRPQNTIHHDHGETTGVRARKRSSKGMFLWLFAGRKEEEPMIAKSVADALVHFKLLEVSPPPEEALDVLSLLMFRKVALQLAFGPEGPTRLAVLLNLKTHEPTLARELCDALHFPYHTEAMRDFPGHFEGEPVTIDFTCDSSGYGVAVKLVGRAVLNA